MRITSVNRSAMDYAEPTLSAAPIELYPVHEVVSRSSSSFDDVPEHNGVDVLQTSIQSASAPLVRSSPPNYERATSLCFDKIGMDAIEESGLSADAAKMAADMAAVGRMYGQGMQNRDVRRLVQKSGECNVVNRNVTKRKRSYLVDIFTTLVDMRWRLHAVFFASAFVITWCTFAFVWWIIATAHGDLEKPENETHTPCVDNVFDYRTALLFSIETQHTIGYGFRAITNECWYAVIVLMLQSCVGMVVQTLITGIIFVKISRPKGRAQTIMFSQKAVICQRDGEYYLLFRVGDMRKSHIIGTSMRALLVKNRLTREGESIPLCQYPLTLETENYQSDCFIFLIWPVTLQHKIDKDSPLWDLSAEKLYKEHFEIIIILEGTIESTGMLTQVRTSYIPREIGWAERLVPLLTFQLQNGRYEIDYGQFHSTSPMVMLTCSAKISAEMEGSGRARNVEKDYPINFTAPAIYDVPAHKSIYGLFHRNQRPPATGDRSGNVKRKAVAVRDRKISEDETRRQELDGAFVDPIRNPIFEALTKKQRTQIMKNIEPNRKSCTLPSRAPHPKERRNAVDLHMYTVCRDGGEHRLDSWNEVAILKAAEGRSLDKIFPKTNDSEKDVAQRTFKKFEDTCVDNGAYESPKETEIEPPPRPHPSRFVVSPARDDTRSRPASASASYENKDRCTNSLYDGRIDYNVKAGEAVVTDNLFHAAV